MNKKDVLLLVPKTRKWKLWNFAPVFLTGFPPYAEFFQCNWLDRIISLLKYIVNRFLSEKILNIKRKYIGLDMDLCKKVRSAAPAEFFYNNFVEFYPKLKYSKSKLLSLDSYE